jgi:mono/diheme cytochrome c family protein
VLYGLQGQVTVNGRTYNGVMPGFAGSLNDDQISQTLTYIRSSWGNNNGAVSAGVVKEERAKPGTPADNYQKYPK